MLCQVNSNMWICLKMGGKFLCLQHSKSILRNRRVAMHNPLILPRGVTLMNLRGSIYFHGKNLIHTWWYLVSTWYHYVLIQFLTLVVYLTYLMIHWTKNCCPLDLHYDPLDRKLWSIWSKWPTWSNLWSTWPNLLVPWPYPLVHLTESIGPFDQLYWSTWPILLVLLTQASGLLDPIHG